MTDRDQADSGAGRPAEAGASALPEAPPEAVEESAATPAAETAAPEQRTAPRNLTYGIAALIIFLAGVAVWPLAGPWLEPLLPASWRSMPADLDDIRARLSALEARPAGAKAVDLSPLRAALADEVEAREQAVAALADRVAAAEKQVQALPRGGADTAAVDELSRRLDEIQGGMSALGGNAASLQRVEEQVAATAATVKTLESQVATLEKAIGDAAAARRRQGLLLAVGQLAAAVDAGRGFVDELARLQEFADDDAQITAAAATLAARAATGVPTVGELRRRFGPLAGAIVRAAATAGDDGWLARAAARLKGLVTVRRTGDVGGGETDAIVARAEVRLNDGDLRRALEELAALEGAAAAAAADWSRDAEARLAADQALAKLQGRAVALLGES